MRMYSIVSKLELAIAGSEFVRGSLVLIVDKFKKKEMEHNNKNTNGNPEEIGKASKMMSMFVKCYYMVLQSRCCSGK